MEYDMLVVQGYNSSLWGVSITIYTAIVIIVDLKLAIHTKYWTSFNVIALVIFSLIIYIAYLIISNFIAGKVFSTPLAHFYLVIILAVGTILLYDLLMERLCFMFKANLTDLIRWM